MLEEWGFPMRPSTSVAKRVSSVPQSVPLSLPFSPDVVALSDSSDRVISSGVSDVNKPVPLLQPKKKNSLKRSHKQMTESDVLVQSGADPLETRVNHKRKKKKFHICFLFFFASNNSDILCCFFVANRRGHAPKRFCCSMKDCTAGFDTACELNWHALRTHWKKGAKCKICKVPLQDTIKVREEHYYASHKVSFDWVNTPELYFVKQRYEENNNEFE